MLLWELVGLLPSKRWLSVLEFLLVGHSQLVLYLFAKLYPSFTHHFLYQIKKILAVLNGVAHKPLMILTILPFRSCKETTRQAMNVLQEETPKSITIFYWGRGQQAPTKTPIYPTLKVVIKVPTPFHYASDKVMPWNYVNQVVS